MSRTRRDGGEAHAVRELVRESLSEPVPAIDWERVESGIFASIAAGRAGGRAELPRGRGTIVSVGAVALAAAAAVALVASSMVRGPRLDSAKRTAVNESTA